MIQKRSPLLLLLVGAVLLLAACAEKGDKAIARGNGMGDDWKPVGYGQMRIAAQNLFTRDVVIHANAPGRHYEMTVGPIRESYMIVPDAPYQIQAFTREKSTGGTNLFITPGGSTGARVLKVKISPF